ncbi:hypothetical protein PPYR_00910 [Photinus pyralis]|uniref:Uncharacterized protein n=1 Tax=Photinus pyralis TaxID=7054 RepID=A0A1Y1LK77_PHOPY|nr:uncharacterized protein LOC116182419 [Photinus pyralis]KAB0803940.1 hypothetical protein PPYR_00910 [Photinus pyralis]
MKLLCVAFAVVLGVSSKSFHANLGPEMACLKEQNLTLKDVFPYVHIVSDVNNEVVGRYLECVWKKWNILTSNGNVSGADIYKYLTNIYHNANLTENNKQEMRDASNKCAKVTDQSEWILANKVKNCIIKAVNEMPFLTQPKPHN